MKESNTVGQGANRRALVLLVAGALLGMGAATIGVLEEVEVRGGPLPEGVIASVNGAWIHRADYDRTLAALTADRRNPIDDEQRRFILERLIDEELLVQRGLDLGLAQHDARVRKDLTLAIIESVVADYRDRGASDRELQAFFDENREYFAQAGRFRVRQIWVRARTLADGEAAFERAREAAERLRRGEPFESVRDELGDPESPPVPDALLPPNKLADYLGPTVLRAALDLEVGQISNPVRSSTGFHVLELVERGTVEVPEFAAVQTQVLAEYRRRQADAALRSYLERLREQADIEIALEFEDATS